jgi:hypothetical protein
VRPTEQRIYRTAFGNRSKDREANLLHKVRFKSSISIHKMARRRLTSSPVQNMGHLLHGVSLAFGSHVLRYGFRTMRGNTGGVSCDASPVALKHTAANATAVQHLIASRAGANRPTASKEQECQSTAPEETREGVYKQERGRGTRGETLLGLSSDNIVQRSPLNPGFRVRGSAWQARGRSCQALANPAFNTAPLPQLESFLITHLDL